jgi:hypothetical protein
MITGGQCEGCGERTALIPLHGEKGGPLRCPLCVGKWNAQYGRNRNRGRVVIRAIKNFLDGGGEYQDIDKLKMSALGTRFNHIGMDHLFDPLGYMAGLAKSADEVIELTSELLDDVLVLVHPTSNRPSARNWPIASRANCSR